MQYYWVYMVGSDNGNALYTGVTNNLLRRIREHKEGRTYGFTKHYNCHNLLYFEQHSDIRNAIAREKQIKSWSRQKKEALIASLNPSRKDLADDLNH